MASYELSPVTCPGFLNSMDREGECHLQAMCEAGREANMMGRVGRVGGVQNGHVTSLVDNAGGVMVLQNLETAVRKNMEIQKVNNNIIRIIEKRAERKAQRSV